jgi:hypothetical protein
VTSPAPGFSAPAPRTWALGDLLTTPRLRDMTNLATLFTTGRPLFAGINGNNSVLTASTQNAMGITFTYANNWGVEAIGGSTYAIPLAGWWLVQANAAVQPPATTPVDGKYAVGFKAVINGAGAVTFDGGASPAGTASGSTDVTGMHGADLYQFNPAQSDTIAWYVFVSETTTLWSNMLMAEWIGLPTSGLTGYSGPYGTVVSSPQAPAAWPSGPGTYITNSGGISAGATSVTVTDATGMVNGGYLGLDYISGQLYQPAGEVVTISSVSGTTIGISATNFAHLQNAPVAVPVSPAFLNQQVRDIINFLSYPPMLRVITTGTQSIASTGFPPTVSGNPTNQITTFATPTLDNFSGFSSSAYTVPVSGFYYVYGQVYLAGSTSAFSMAAGISVNGGTIQWGTTARAATAAGAESMCPTVTRHLRLTAGQTITLWAYQGSGSSMNTVGSGSDVSRLICIWRAA